MPAPCRVEMWRSGGRLSCICCRPFRVAVCLTGSAMAPFPHPAHRTGHADFPLDIRPGNEGVGHPTMTKIKTHSKRRFTHGGARPGAGRKAGLLHKMNEMINAQSPIGSTTSIISVTQSGSLPSSRTSSSSCSTANFEISLLDRVAILFAFSRRMTNRRGNARVLAALKSISPARR